MRYNIVHDYGRDSQRNRTLRARPCAPPGIVCWSWTLVRLLLAGTLAPQVAPSVALACRPASGTLSSSGILRDPANGSGWFQGVSLTRCRVGNCSSITHLCMVFVYGRKV